MKPIAVMLSLFILYGWVGSMDYADEQAESDVYRDRVCNGVWGNYRGLELDCSTVSVRGDRY